MESMTLKVKELEKEIAEIDIKFKEDKNKLQKLNLEISQVKFMQNDANCSFNDYNRRSENLFSDLKDIHQVYQQLPKRSMEEFIQCEVLKRKNELLQEKHKLESKVGFLTLKRSMQEEKLQELTLQAVIQQKKKNAFILKLKKNIEQSEEAKKEILSKLTELKKEKPNF